MGFKWKIGLDSSTNHPPIIPKSNQATLPLKWHPNEQIQYHLYNTIEVSCPLNPFCFVQKRDEPEIYSIYSWLVRPFLNGHKLRYPPFFQEPMAVIYIYTCSVVYVFESYTDIIRYSISISKKTQVFSHSRCLYRHFGEAIHLFCLQAADSWDPDQAAGLLPWCTWQPYDGGNPGTVVSFKLVLMDVHFIINPFHHLSTRWSNSFAGAIPTSDIHPFSLNFAVRLCLTAPMKQPEYKYPSDR